MTTSHFSMRKIGTNRLARALPAVLTALAACSAAVSAADRAAWETRLGTARGIVLVYGEADAAEATEIARKTDATVFLQVPRAEDAQRIRAALEPTGLLGRRLYVSDGSPARLQLADNVADAVVVPAGVADADRPERGELLRVLRPRGRLDVAGRTETKPVPEGTGVWTHPYHGPDNNPLAEDTLARGPYLTQFLAAPYYGPMPEVTVTAGGRLFKAFGHVAYKQREWPLLNKLIVFDAYNGTRLWERDLLPGFVIHRSTLIATDDVLYLGDNDSCKVLDAATGRLLREISFGPDVADGPCWKWMALEGGTMYALLGGKEPLEPTKKGDRRQSGWPWNDMGPGYAGPDSAWGFGRSLVAFDPATGKVRWKRREADLLDSRALCLRNGRLYVYAHPKFVAALDVADGGTVWKNDSAELLKAMGANDRAQTWRRGYNTQSFVKATDDVLLFAGPQRPRLLALAAKDGRLLWDREDGNYQLVLRDGVCYAMGKTSKSLKLDPKTGEVLAELDCLRGNCTRATGTFDAVFARGDSHGGTLRLDVLSDAPHRLPAMRPACQDGVIAANGLLYWGPWMCDCNHSLVGIVGLGPAGDFDFSKPAVESERRVAPVGLEAGTPLAPFDADARDWTTYRANNRRTAATTVAVPKKTSLRWTRMPVAPLDPTAPVTAGGLVVVAGSDGVVRALDAATGTPKWTAFTGGPVRYSPTIAEGRVHVGSYDGWAYAFEAATGKPLWRFRAAPVERRIPVYDRIASTWPVATGVLVEDGTAYLGAGIVSPDGTHVFALDAATGRIRWKNHASGSLMPGGAVSGVSVQGHLLLNGGTLYMAGGNVVSPAKFDVRTGECLNVLTNEWQKAPRGSELFLVGDEVAVVDTMLYAPREYIPSRYYAKYLLEAVSGDVTVQGTENVLQRIDRTRLVDGRPTVVWNRADLVETSAVALAANAVVVLGQVAGAVPETPQAVLLAIDPQDGKELWRHDLPVPAAPWGLAIDRAGRVHVALSDGRVLCFAE